MKFYKLIIFILVIFIKTGNVFSSDNTFNVNNIEVTKKAKVSNAKLADTAIKKGFEELIKKILLSEDKKKLSQLSFIEIKNLVAYYRVSSREDNTNEKDKLNFDIYFDKEKIHNLFFQKNIFYSEIQNKELYLLPILKKIDQVNVFNQNYFYDNWNDVFSNKLIEFILPLENIEVIQKINLKKNQLLELEISNLFQEYPDNNLALILIEEPFSKNEKIYIKTRILGKKVDKSFNIKKTSENKIDHFEKIVNEVSTELINLIKSRNLIDIRTPSFLNTKLILRKNNNLVELNKRLEKIGLIEDIFVQEFNNEYILLKLKYLGKLSKIIELLEKQKIMLKQMNDNWVIQII